jgi:hypothetical protein
MCGRECGRMEKIEDEELHDVYLLVNVVGVIS